jgi:hypothetical protein
MRRAGPGSSSRGQREYAVFRVGDGWHTRTRCRHQPPSGLPVLADQRMTDPGEALL